MKTWAFPAPLTICYRHLGMGAAYYNLLCDSHDNLWTFSYSTASSSTKSSSALIRNLIRNQNFLKALPTAASANSLDSLTSVPLVLKYLQKSLLWPGRQRWGDTHMLLKRLSLWDRGSAQTRTLFQKWDSRSTGCAGITPRLNSVITFQPPVSTDRLSEMEILFTQSSWKDFVSIKSFNPPLRTYKHPYHSLCPAKRILTA